jgi:hypothetical protein
MSSEKQMRGNVVKALRAAKLDARPVENPVDPGFPDVEYIGGLLELKEVDEWPARADTILRIEHYTQEQRIWHERRAHHGGRIHVLLQVGREYLLFKGAVAAQHLGRVPRATLYDLACMRWSSLADLSSGLAVALKEHG